MSPPPPADAWSPLGRTLVWDQAMAPVLSEPAPGTAQPGKGAGTAADGRDRAAAARRSRTDLEYLTPAELIDRARGFLPLLGELCAVAGLGAGPPTDVESPAAGQALWELSRMVARSADLPLYFDGGVPEILERLDGSPSTDAKAFLDAFDTLLYEHGYLGPGGWDIAAAVWETDPDLPLRELDRLRSLPDGDGPSGDGAPPAAAAARIVNEIRIALREVGRQVADAHHIASADLVMLLTADELDDFAAHPETFGLKLADRARTR